VGKVLRTSNFDTLNFIVRELEMHLSFSGTSFFSQIRGTFQWVKGLLQSFLGRMDNVFYSEWTDEFLKFSRSSTKTFPQYELFIISPKSFDLSYLIWVPLDVERSDKIQLITIYRIPLLVNRKEEASIEIVKTRLENTQKPEN
jgi:hypothetical protein